MQSRIDRLFNGLPDDCGVFISGYPNIFYYSGFTSEDAFLLMTKTERYIITDSRYFIQAKIQSPDFELIDIKKGWEYISTYPSANPNVLIATFIHMVALRMKGVCT